MKSLSACASTDLEWRQLDGTRRIWELVGEGDVVSTLAFDRPINSLATLSTADGVWQMRRERGVRLDVLIFEPDNPEPIGAYHPHWTGKDGVLMLQNHREFTWVATNFWNTRFEIRDSTTNKVLLRYTRGLNREGFRDIFKTQAIMEVVGSMVRDANLALLSGWGFYQAVLHREQSMLMGKSKWFMFAAPGAPSTKTPTEDREY